MKNFLLCIATATAALSTCTFTASAEENTVTLYGVKTYCESDGAGGTHGIYSVEASPDAQPQLYWADGDMMGNGGAVYTDDKYYVLSYFNFGYMFLWSYQICDVENKTYDFLSPDYLEPKDAGSAMTYDPVTGNVYSICIDANDTEKLTLSIMDVSTGAKTPVAPISERMFAMACTADGTLYGIGPDGVLNTIDKKTAALTPVGPTGVTPQSNQSAVIDYATNIMYWCAYTAEGGFLYTVDITTGEATLLSTFDDKHQIVGLFIKQTSNATGAPASLTELSADFDKASLSGTINFKAPETDTEGKPLSGELTYFVGLDEEVLATGTARPGEDVRANVSVSRSGDYRFSVNVANSAGSSRTENITLWVGLDTPLPVTNCLLTYDDGVLNLSWELPERGVNGGYVDPGLTRYSIIRGPYEATVDNAYEGTAFSETYEQQGVNPVMYLVTPVLEGLTGEPTLSNTVVAGGYSTIPYAEDFTDQFRSLVFTAFDVNDDGSWLYNFDEKAMYCEWPLQPESDDWLISSPVKLETDKKYVVKATVRSEGQWNYDEERYDDIYAGTLGIYLGTEATPEAMAETILAPFDVISKDYDVYQSPAFTVPAEGLYNFGLHLSGVRSIYYTYLKNIEIAEDDNTGVDESAQACSLSVRTNGTLLLIGNPDGLTVNVYRPDGSLAATTSDSEAALTLAKGLYIVSAPGHTAKVSL